MNALEVLEKHTKLDDDYHCCCCECGSCFNGKTPAVTWSAEHQVDELRKAGWELREVSPRLTADGMPIYYCAGCADSPMYIDKDEFWCPSCERVTTGRLT